MNMPVNNRNLNAKVVATSADHSAIIIDSTPGVRHLDDTLSSPSSLQSVQQGRTVLDWALHALRENDFQQITYVGGYHIQKVIECYPSLQYRFHAHWQSEGELAGLLSARPDRPTNLLIVRAGTICVPKAVRLISKNKEEIAIGCYGKQSAPTFAGLVMIPAHRSQSFFEQVTAFIHKQAASGLEEVLTSIHEQGQLVKWVNVDGYAAPRDDRGAVARTVFGGKGQTLEQIRPLIKNAVVLDQIRFSALLWRKNPGSLIATIQQSLSADQLVVRSNSHGEDGMEESSAGVFHSVLGIDRSDSKAVFTAVEEVINSYAAHGRAIHELDEVLVQPQVSNLTSSGVMLTRDMDTGAPYHVVNIDRTSGRSDTVTSGAEAALDTYYISHDADTKSLPNDIQRCTDIACELKQLTQMDALDIEFGFDKDGHTYLFQVRPIASRARTFELADEDLFEEITNIRRFLQTHFAPHPMLQGDRTMFGTMPDWNPAEMIGTAPRPLALSLYQMLIGNDAWALARQQIGYRDCRPEPLIISLAGRPYVDVRASLNSFLPSGLEDNVARRWVNQGLALLEQNPELHDKIEFEVAATCLTFDFTADRQRMQDAGLSESEITTFRKKLLKLTDSAILGNTASINAQIAELQILENKRQRRLQHAEPTRPGLARRVNALLRDCERHGTAPFSVLARYGFIALSIMKSLKNLGVFSNDEYEAVLREIPTVASGLSQDLSKFAAREVPLTTLLEKYGHLRPNSYDITSPNYSNAIDTYLSNVSAPDHRSAYPNPEVAKNIFDSNAKNIESLMKQHGFSASAKQLRDFVLQAIPGREWAKFEFTKSLNAALESIAEYGKSLDFSREEISFLPIHNILRVASDCESGAVRTRLRRAIEFNKKRWNLTSAIRLPHLICKLEEIKAFRRERWQPNFITTRRIAGKPIYLEDMESAKSLKNHIVMIRAADPGYDWIFGHEIAGLITQYGGVASHMAIRAAEFGLPAAIGCGEVIFERLRNMSWIELDCASKTVKGSDDHCGLDASGKKHELLRTA